LSLRFSPLTFRRSTMGSDALETTRCIDRPLQLGGSKTTMLAAQMSLALRIQQLESVFRAQAYQASHYRSFFSTRQGWLVSKSKSSSWAGIALGTALWQKINIGCLSLVDKLPAASLGPLSHSP
jgi:hypothetical protein